MISILPSRGMMFENLECLLDQLDAYAKYGGISKRYWEAVVADNLESYVSRAYPLNYDYGADGWKPRLSFEIPMSQFVSVPDIKPFHWIGGAVSQEAKDAWHCSIHFCDSSYMDRKGKYDRVNGNNFQQTADILKEAKTHKGE